MTVLTACGKTVDDADQGAPMFVQDHGLLVVPEKSPLRTHLVIASVSDGTSQGQLNAPAQVEADPASVINILAPLAGRVTALHVHIGDRVQAGQVLAVIDSGDLAQANADVVKAADAADLAQKALERAQGVHDAGGAAIKDLEAAQSAYTQAKAELDRAQVRQKSLNSGGNAAELVLSAPEGGIITTLNIAEGSQISDPTATLMTLTNTSRVFVTGNLGEATSGSVHVGDAAQVTLNAYPGQVLTGRVASVSPILEPDTRRRKVRISIDNHTGTLLPNMFGTVSFSEPKATAAVGLSVPQSALLMNNDTITVLVEVRPWTFERRVVKLGDEDDNSAQVLSGVSQGERVVVRGGVLLND